MTPIAASSSLTHWYARRSCVLALDAPLAPPWLAGPPLLLGPRPPAPAICPPNLRTHAPLIRRTRWGGAPRPRRAAQKEHPDGGANPGGERDRPRDEPRRDVVFAG